MSDKISEMIAKMELALSSEAGRQAVNAETMAEREAREISLAERIARDEERRALVSSMPRTVQPDPEAERRAVYGTSGRID